MLAQTRKVCLLSCRIVILVLCANSSFSQQKFSIDPMQNLDSAVYYTSIDHSKTRSFIDKALEQSVQTQNMKALVETLILSGREYHLNGDSEKGRNELYQALVIAEKMQDEQLKSFIFDNLGLNFRNNYSFDKANYYFDKSLKIKMRNADTLGWANIISNKSCIYRDQELFDKAIYYNDSAMALLKNYTSSHLYHELIFLRSNYYKSIENYDSSYYYMDKYRVYAERALPFECTQTYIELAGLGLLLKKDKLAELYLNKAVESINSKTNLNTLLVVYNDFSLYYELKGDFKSALNYMKKAYEFQYQSLRRKLSGKSSNPETEFNLFKEQSKSRAISMEKELSEERLYRVMLLLLASIFIIILLALLIVSRVINQRKLREQKNELRDKNEKLLQVNSEKDALMLMISHNLKTPLVGIKYLVRSLVNDEVAENTEAKKKINTIYSSIGQVLDLTDEVIESSKPSSDKESVELGKVIDDLIMIHGEHARNKNITVKHIGSSEITILSNKQRIVNVIDNLLSNAVKYSEHNTDITIESDLRRSKYVRVAVNNQGVKTTTFPVDSDHSEISQSSSGVGLLIVKKYINDLKGKLWHSTGPDRSIKYSFVIPVH